MDNNNSLKKKFPDIASEWDYDKNISLTSLMPENITVGSHLVVYWKCPICKQSYKKKICNRTAPSKRKTESKKCPICLGRTILPGFNSLKAKYPDIVSKEWDYDKNTIDPDEIAPHQNKPKYWWKCPQEHSYNSSANNKVNGTGGNCPYCSHQRLLPELTLAYVNPELAKEWCFKKNTISPDDVFSNSNKKVWWECEKGHVWEAKIYNRSNGRGCAECKKGHQSSFPEQALYYYIKILFPDAINGYKYDKKTEIDIYIPSFKIGIEYDGEYYHNSEKRFKNDLYKNKILSDDGIFLLRVRESNCIKMSDVNCLIYSYNYSSNHKKLDAVIKKVLDTICNKTNKTNDLIIDIKSIKNEIIKNLCTIQEGKDLGSQNITLSKDWDYEKNYPLTPAMVNPNSEKKVFWKCQKCGYIWEALINSRNRGSGCPKCSKRQRYTTKEWVEEAIKKQGVKYDYSRVEYINSITPVIIICSIHGEFTQPPTEHLQGKGCKYCANQAFHPSNSLAILNPDIAAEWDYEKNKDTNYTPDNIGINHVIKFWWHCNEGKPHSYKATIGFRVGRKSGCAVCCGKQMDFTTSVEYLRPDLAKEWCVGNVLKPSEISLGSEKKILWKCNNLIHKPYKAAVYNRAHLNSGCPECAGNIKSPQSYAIEVYEKFPYIELLKDYKKSGDKVQCRCKICGYEWNPFPFNLLKGKGCLNCRKV